MFIHHTDHDITGILLQAIQKMHADGDTLLTFEKGSYHFYPDNAFEQVSCISNHDNDGFKRIALPFFDFDGLTVDGNGSDFIFHGIILPIEIGNCKNTVLQNFSIDCAIAPYAHATVLEASAHMLKIRIWDNTPFQVVHHSLRFSLGDHELWETNFFLDIDATTDMCTEGTYRIPCQNMDAVTDPDDPQIVTLLGDFLHIPAIGNTVCFHFGIRWTSGIFIHNSENTFLKNVSVHSSLGMGILAQLCKNLTFKHLRITPSAGRYMSVPADGTHFVNCSGQIHLENCLMEKHFDDCLNCHGIYMQIQQILDRRTVLAKLVHHQQQGLTLFHPHERVELVNHKTLLPRCKNHVSSFEHISRSLAIIQFEEEIEDSVQLLDCIESIDACPDLTVKNCTLQKAFPRGLLITTRGNVLIENNYFQTTASAIHISGDCNNWFESGYVQNMIIQNNTFYRCGIAKASGRTPNYNVINIVPSISTPDISGEYFHKNICITGNQFITAHPNVLKAVSVQNLIFRQNTFDISEPIVTLTNCDGKIQI